MAKGHGGHGLKWKMHNDENGAMNNDSGIIISQVMHVICKKNILKFFLPQCQPCFPLDMTNYLHQVSSELEAKTMVTAQRGY